MKTDNVLDFKSAFSECMSLETIKMPKNKIKIKFMEFLFYECYKLTSIDLSNFDVESVESMFDMFYDCRSLKSIDLSTFNTPNLVSMISMFQGCHSLTSIDLSNFNTSKMLYYDEMFYGCNNLAFIDISSFKVPSNPLEIYNLFDSNISINGEIIINKDFYNKINDIYLDKWNKSLT